MALFLTLAYRGMHSDTSVLLIFSFLFLPSFHRLCSIFFKAIMTQGNEKARVYFPRVVLVKFYLPVYTRKKLKEFMDVVSIFYLLWDDIMES